MRKTILQNQVGVLIENGKFLTELKPGEVRYSRFFKNQQVEVFDVRPTYTTLVDNYMTRDQLSLHIGISLSYSIEEALAYLKTVNDVYNAVRTIINDDVRAWASQLTLDELLEKQSELQSRLEQKATVELKQYGLKLESLSPPVITLPRGLKQAVEAKVIASKKSQADLEEARGRTAVLRHYANAARLVADQPELLKLLLGQKAKSLQVQFTDKQK